MSTKYKRTAAQRRLDECEQYHRNKLSYNGWANYETWLVNMWLDNEEGTYDHYRDLAKTCNIGQLALQLKEDVEAGIDLMYDNGVFDQGPIPGLYLDMLRGAMSEVVWYSIAEHMQPDEEEDSVEDEDN